MLTKPPYRQRIRGSILNNFSFKDERIFLEAVLVIINQSMLLKGTNLWMLIFAILMASQG